MTEKQTARGLHRDWRTWAVVAVMLLAATAYVLNLDQVIVPVAGTAKPPVSVPGSP